jgi:cold shock CspA family protein
MSVFTKTGRVKLRSATFAFLAADDGSLDVFVPRSVIEESGLALSKGDHVTYTFEPNARGPRATSIALAT